MCLKKLGLVRSKILAIFWRNLVQNDMYLNSTKVTVAGFIRCELKMNWNFKQILLLSKKIASTGSNNYPRIIIFFCPFSFIVNGLHNSLDDSAVGRSVDTSIGFVTSMEDEEEVFEENRNY